MFRWSVIFLILLMAGDVCCQEYYKYTAARLDYGFVIIHSRALRNIENSNPIGLELDFGRHRTSEKSWSRCNCFPKSGVSLTAWDFDNPEVLGYGATGMYYLQPVFGAGNRFNVSVRAAIGFSYQSKPHHPDRNPDNQSYSTYVAFPLQLGGALHYRFTERWKADLNLVFNHISNGGMKEPNKGINWPTVGIGLSRYMTVPKFPERVRTDWQSTSENRDRLDLSLFGTYHQPRPINYIISMGLEIRYARRISRLNNITLGAEWMYDRGQVFKAREEMKIDGNNLGAGIGHEFILGDFLFGQQFAVYFIKPPSQDSSLYQRYTLTYSITKSIFAGVALKAHGHVADFADVRVGYSF